MNAFRETTKKNQPQTKHICFMKYNLVKIINLYKISVKNVF